MTKSTRAHALTWDTIAAAMPGGSIANAIALATPLLWAFGIGPDSEFLKAAVKAAEEKQTLAFTLETDTLVVTVKVSK